VIYWSGLVVLSIALFSDPKSRPTPTPKIEDEFEDEDDYD
jgi:hypothetical protein